MVRNCPECGREWNARILLFSEYERSKREVIEYYDQMCIEMADKPIGYFHKVKEAELR